MMSVRGPSLTREQPLWDVQALWFYPPGAAKLDPTPPFLDLFITKDFKSNEFGSVHSEGVTERFFGSADSKGVRGFESAFAR
jgi:hypothetical protein